MASLTLVLSAVRSWPLTVFAIRIFVVVVVVSTHVSADRNDRRGKRENILNPMILPYARFFFFIYYFFSPFFSRTAAIKKKKPPYQLYFYHPATSN